MYHQGMRIGQRIVAIICFGVLLGGCGPSSAATNATATSAGNRASVSDADTTADQAPTSGIDPCTLLTKADAEAALGEVVENEPVRSDTFPQGCQYIATHTPLRSASVSLITSTMLKDAGSPTPTTTQFYTAMKQDATVEPVAGMGNEAAWVKTENVTLPQLWAVHGDVLVTVAVGAPAEENMRTPTETLAKLVVARLP